LRGTEPSIGDGCRRGGARDPERENPLPRRGESAERRHAGHTGNAARVLQAASRVPGVAREPLSGICRRGTALAIVSRAEDVIASVESGGRSAIRGRSRTEAPRPT
jgi:hypothetical protein